MDDGQDTSLVAELVRVEDPRPARVLAALRNALSTFLRATGWHRIADALRHFGVNVAHALTFVTGSPLRV
jgi:hypothetical protein